MAEAAIKNNAIKQKASVSAINISKYREAGFSKLQCMIIKKGLEEGLKVDIFAKKNFSPLQMEEIKKGLAEGFDVSVFAKPEFNRQQMKELRHGLQKNIDITEFADPDNDAKMIKAMVLAKEKHIDISEFLKRQYSGKQTLMYVNGKIDGVDLTKYIERGLDEDQLAVFIEAQKEGINLDPYAGLGLYGVQLQEVMEGLKKGINVSSYANGRYNWMQMAEIREGIEKGLNTKVYTDPDFTHLQMKQIRLGLEDMLDVSGYAQTSIEPERMAELREEAFNEAGYADQINKILEGSAVAELINAPEMPELDFDIGAEAEKLLEKEEVINPAVALAKELVGDIAQEIEEKEIDEETIREDVAVTVSEDKMRAFVNVSQPVGDRVYTIRDITRALREYDVKQGISQEAISRLINEKNYFVDVLVAEGKEAVKGVDGFFTFNFKKEYKPTPKILPNGSVDYKGMELFETVDKGDVIVTYTPPTAGDFGYDVLGNLVTPE